MTDYIDLGFALHKRAPELLLIEVWRHAATLNAPIADQFDVVIGYCSAPAAARRIPKGPDVMNVFPGDRLVIRGYGGNVLEKHAVYKRSYEVGGIKFIVFESDGVTKSVDAGRVEPAEEAAIVQFGEKLAAAIDILSDIGANYCGDLTEKQAMRFHKAVAKLEILAEEVES